MPKDKMMLTLFNHSVTTWKKRRGKREEKINLLNIFQVLDILIFITQLTRYARHYYYDHPHFKMKCEKLRVEEVNEFAYSYLFK